MLRILVGMALLVPGLAMAAGDAAKPRVRFETTKGVIVLELEAAKAPKTVANFLAYVKSGFYNATIFHRVIPGFVIQGGGFTADMQRKSTQAAIVNEAGNGLKNVRGTVCMARLPEPNTATSQFFINLVNNSSLDHRDNTAEGFGYCVFGRVVAGMEVVDAIAKVPTGSQGPYEGVPTQPVVITKAVIVEAAPAAKPPAPQGSGHSSPR